MLPIQLVTEHLTATLKLSEPPYQRGTHPEYEIYVFLFILIKHLKRRLKWKWKVLAYTIIYQKDKFLDIHGSFFVLKKTSLFSFLAQKIYFSEPKFFFLTAFEQICKKSTSSSIELKSFGVFKLFMWSNILLLAVNNSKLVCTAQQINSMFSCSKKVLDCSNWSLHLLLLMHQSPKTWLLDSLVFLHWPLLWMAVCVLIHW